MSVTTKQIKTDHKDLIQDIAFDFYGKRVATASLDHTVKIWSIGENNQWIFKEELKVTWPDDFVKSQDPKRLEDVFCISRLVLVFTKSPGLIQSLAAWLLLHAIASYGESLSNRHFTVPSLPIYSVLIPFKCKRLYEETCFGTSKSVQSSWIKRMPAFTDARAPITDMKFAPKHIGLLLVLCAQNGDVRIYECTDVLSSNAWTLVHPEVKTNLSSCSSCSWSTCFNLPILLALGSDENTANSDKLVIFEFNENKRTYSKIEKAQVICSDPIRSLAFAPSIGKLYHVLAIASKSLLVVTIKPT